MRRLGRLEKRGCSATWRRTEEALHETMDTGVGVEVCCVQEIWVIGVRWINVTMEHNELMYF